MNRRTSRTSTAKARHTLVPAVAEIVHGAGIAAEIEVAADVLAAVDADVGAAVVPVGAAVADVTADTVAEAAEGTRTFRHGSARIHTDRNIKGRNPQAAALFLCTQVRVRKWYKSSGRILPGVKTV